MKQSILPTLITLLFFGANINAQNIIKPAKGYSPNIGNTITMLDDLKGRVVRSVRNLDQKGTDFLLDHDANRVGAMILHLAATEKYYQIYTFENRGFNAEEEKEWGAAMNLGDQGRAELVGKPIDYYLDIWKKTRDETKRLLKTKDDEWFAKKVKGSSMNNFWAWYHVMEHQANHMGQIRMIVKRIK